MTRVTTDQVLKLFNDRAIQKEKAFKDLPFGTILNVSTEGFDGFKDWLDEHHDDECGTTRFRNAGCDFINGFGLKIELRSDRRNTVMLGKLTFGGI